MRGCLNIIRNSGVAPSDKSNVPRGFLFCFTLGFFLSVTYVVAPWATGGVKPIGLCMKYMVNLVVFLVREQQS